LKHVPAVARPPRCHRPTTRTRRKYIAARDKAAPLCIFRVFLLLLRSVAALPALANCNGHVAKTNISRPHQPKLCALCTAPTASEVGVVKALQSPVLDTRAGVTGISCFPCQTFTRSYLPFSAPLRPFSPACSPVPACFFARYCAHAGGPVR
jgi:hypothetical protein